MTGRPYPTPEQRITRLIEATEVVQRVCSRVRRVTFRGEQIVTNEATLARAPAAATHVSRCSSAATTAGCSSSRGAHADIVGIAGLGRTLEDGHQHTSGGAKRTSTARSRRSADGARARDDAPEHRRARAARRGDARSRGRGRTPRAARAEPLIPPMRSRARSCSSAAKPSWRPRCAATTNAGASTGSPSARTPSTSPRRTHQVAALTDPAHASGELRADAARGVLGCDLRRVLRCHDRASRAAASCPGASPRT